MAREGTARFARRQLVQSQDRRESASRSRPRGADRASLGLEGPERRELADLPGWEGASKVTESYTLFALPDETHSHFESRLTRGGEFGRSLAERLRYSEWRFWTVVPAGAALELNRSLNDGGVASSKETRAWLSARIARFLQRGSENIALFENDSARPGDEWLRACESKLTYSVGRVLHYAQAGDSATEVDQAIRDAQSPHLLVGALIESGRAGLGHELSDADLRRLASMAVAIISDAFDGESYVVAEQGQSASIAWL